MDGIKILILAVLIISACEIKKSNKEQTIIDDSNSRYANKLCYGEAIPNRFIVRWKSGDVSLVNGMDKEELKIKFLNLFGNEIEAIEQDRRITIKYMNKSDEEVTLPTDSWGTENVMAQDVWDQNIKGDNISIAVVDSGIDISHSQLRNQIFINSSEIPDNLIDDDNNGLIDDYYGFDFFTKTGEVVPVGVHGTHVAGIIAAEENTGLISGIAPKAKILPLNFMDHQQAGGSMGDAIMAIEYSIKRGVKIINASWGGSSCSVSLKSTIDKLADNNILFVAAAGNEGLELDSSPEYPAAYRSISQLTVGAIMPSSRMAGFSNYSDKLVDLMAPGSMIWSTVPNNNYDALSGTSMAAPFVTGAAALLWSKFPEASLSEIKMAILNSVDQAEYRSTSRGRLNIKKAVQWLSQKVY
jgi:subtilisin family serine protease